MEKRSFRFVIFLLLLTLIVPKNDLFAQTEKFDIATFPALKNWNKDTNEGLVTYSTINSSTRTFCNFTLYASSASSGEPGIDFIKSWQKLVSEPFQTDKTPANRSEESMDGWKTITGVSQAEKDGMGFYIFLTVFSGYGRSLSIISQMNDQSYIATIDNLLRAMKLDKTSPVESSVAGIQPVGNPVTKGSEIKDSESFGNIIYKVPVGWTSSKVDPRYVEIFPVKLMPQESFSVLLLQGKVSGASLEQELAECWNDFARLMGAEQLREVSGNSYNTDEINKTAAGWEYIAGHGSMRKGYDYFVHAYVIRVKERIERVIVFSKEIRLDALTNNIDPTVHHTPYYDVITSFIFNLRFKNLSMTELPSAFWKGVGITGAWGGIGFMGGELKVTYAIFFSNGQVYYGSRFPLSGLYNLDSYADKERTPRYWGTYSYEGGNGTVKMQYGSFPIRLEGNKLKMSPVSEEHSFIRMQSVDNLKLNGTWMIAGENDQPNTITFRTDGTYTDNGALKVLDHSLYQYYSIADGGGNGNYQIRDFTIIFNYSDGRILKIAFPGRGLIPGNISPNELVLSFNEDLLIKQ